jgi:hypothetical protein
MSDIADRVQQKAPPLTQRGDEQACDARPEDARAVEHRRVHRDRIHQIFLPDHVDEKRLTGRNVECVHDAEERRDGNHMPHSYGPLERQHREKPGQQHRRRLRGDDDGAAIGVIGGDPADGREKKDGDLAGESDGAEQERRAGQPVDEPRLRDRLHPRPRQ